MIQEMRLMRSSLSVLLTVCAFSSIVSAEGPLSATQLMRGPYLQLSTPSSVSIIWRTTGESQPVVQYGLDPASLDRTLADASILVSRVPKEGEAPNDLSLHSAPEETVQQSSWGPAPKPPRFF